MPRHSCTPQVWMGAQIDRPCSSGTPISKLIECHVRRTWCWCHFWAWLRDTMQLENSSISFHFTAQDLWAGDPFWNHHFLSIDPFLYTLYLCSYKRKKKCVYHEVYPSMHACHIAMKDGRWTHMLYLHFASSWNHCFWAPCLGAWCSVRNSRRDLWFSKMGMTYLNIIVHLLQSPI